MSYHSPGNRFTPDQLDGMADYSNGSRFNVASGRTVWVDCTCGIFGGPLVSVADDVNSVAAGDVVMIRSGNYNERITITKRLMLGTTRGWTTIGAP